MTPEIYARIRAKLYGGHKQNPFVPLLGDRTAITTPIQGTPEEFSQVLYELTRGELTRRTDTVTYEVAAQGKRNILRFKEGVLFNVMRVRGGIEQVLIVVAPFKLSKDELLGVRTLPLAQLVNDTLKINGIYAEVSSDYRREERRIEIDRNAEERKMARESSLDAALATIERAKSGQTIMIRGLQNIDDLVKLGFVPGLVDNPDNWIDAEEFPGLRYRHARSGIEVLLTGREKFRPIEELNRLELHFLVHRSDADPASFGRMRRKFREAKKGGASYSTKEFHDDLVALAKYPEELKGRTEEDLSLMAEEVEHVIDRRQETDKGILPYEAVFRKDTEAILGHILKNRTPASEIRKALDYFEYTGMIDGQYKTMLEQRIKASSDVAAVAVKYPGDILYDRRVKEIVATVLKKLQGHILNAKTITIAMSPYVGELGFGKLVKIRDRILQLREMVHSQ